MADRVLREDNGAVTLLTLNRPDKLNAIDLDMLSELDDALDTVERAAGVRAVVLTGAGRAFSTGGDIRAWSGMGAEDFAFNWVRVGHRVFDRLARLRQPVIAALNGAALGGGLELAAAADIRIAAESAKLGLPEAGLGMVPGWSGTQRLARRFGTQVTRRMALGGEVFSAGEGVTLGIVDRVCPDGKALEEAAAYAERVVARGPEASSAVKLMLAVAEGEESAASVEALAALHVAETAGLREGVAAFKEKRAPNFKGDRE